MIDNKIHEIMNNYAETKAFLDESVKKEDKRLHTLVINQSLTNSEAHEDLKIFKKRADKILSQIQDQSIQAVKDIFDTVKSKIDEFVKAPLPDDFSNTLNTLDIIGDTLTKEEFNKYLENYRGNYLAMRALWSKYSKKFDISLNHEPMKYDDLIEMHIDVRRSVIKWFSTYKPYSYYTMLLLADNSIISRYNAVLEDFLNTREINITPSKVDTVQDIDTKTKDFKITHIKAS